MAVVEELAVAFTTEGEADIEHVLHQLTEAVDHLGETLHHVKPSADQAANGLKTVAAHAAGVGDQLDKIIPKHKKHAATVEEAAIAAAHGRKVVGEGLEEMGVFTEQIAKRMEHVGVTMAFTMASMANGGEAGLARLLHAGASLAFMFGMLPGVLATVGLALGEGLWHAFHKEAEKAAKEEEALIKAAEAWSKKLDEGAGGESFRQAAAIQKEIDKARINLVDLTTNFSTSWAGTVATLKATLSGLFAGVMEGHGLSRMLSGKAELISFFREMGHEAIKAYNDSLEEGTFKVEEAIAEKQALMRATYMEGIRKSREEEMQLSAAAIADFGTLLTSKRSIPVAKEELTSLMQDEMRQLAGLKEGYHSFDAKIEESTKKREEAARRLLAVTTKTGTFDPKEIPGEQSRAQKRAERENAEAEAEERGLKRDQAFQLHRIATAAQNAQKITDMLFAVGNEQFQNDMRFIKQRETASAELFQERLTQNKVASNDEFTQRRAKMEEGNRVENKLLNDRMNERRALDAAIGMGVSQQTKDLNNQLLLLNTDYQQKLRASIWSERQWGIGVLQREHTERENVMHATLQSDVEAAQQEVYEANAVLGILMVLYKDDVAAYNAAVAAKIAAEKRLAAAKTGEMNQHYSQYVANLQREVATGAKMQYDADLERVAHAKAEHAAIMARTDISAEEKNKQLQAILDDELTLVIKAQAKMKAAAQTLGQSIASGITAGMESVFTGGGIGGGFRKLLGALLSGLGDIAIRFGVESAAFMQFLAGIMKAITFLSPEMGLAAAIGMIALGASLKAAGSAMGGGHSGSGGGSASATVNATGGSYSSGLPQIGMISPVSGASRSIGNSGSLSAMQPVIVNATIIGKDDPAAQRVLLEMISRAQRRGTTSG